MAKNFDAVLDAGMDAMKSGAIRVAYCSAEPANYAGIAAVKLGEATITGTDFTGPEAHTPTGRKLTFGGKSGSTPTANGTVTHLVFHDNSAVMWGVTTTTSQAVTTSQSWNIPSCIVPGYERPA